MSKVAIVGAVVVHPDARNEVLRALLAHRERCLRDEKGTLQFEVLLPHEDKTQIMLFEVYADASAFEAHWNGRSMAQIRREIESHVVSLTGIRCSIGSVPSAQS